VNGRTWPVFGSTVTAGLVLAVPIWGTPAAVTTEAVAMFRPL
jgi:hypothetical protein